MAAERYNDESSLYGSDRMSNDFAGVPQDIDIFNKPGMTKRGGRVQERQKCPFGRGLRVYCEEEEPIHPALQRIASRCLDFDESPRPPPDLSSKSIPKSKRLTCADRLQALGSFVNDVENLPEAIEHIQLLKAREQANGDLIREEFRKLGGFSPEDRKSGFFDNYFNDYGIGSEWIKNTSNDDNKKGNNTNVLSDGDYNNDPTPGFALKDSDFPPLSSGPSDLKMMTSLDAATKMSSAPDADKGKPYLPTKVDLDKEQDDDFGRTCTFKSGIGQEEARVREKNTAMWVNSIVDGATATEKYAIEPGCCVVLKNVPEYVSEAQIYETLAVYGQVQSVMFCDWQEGMKFGIVEMRDTCQADEVVDMFQEIRMFGNPPDKPISTAYYNKAF